MSVYAEELLDHYKNPRNKGAMPDETLSLRDSNPMCGDDIVVHAKLEGDKIVKFSFEGQGCAVSQASASMLSERVVGMTRGEVLVLDQEYVVKMLGIPLSGMRMKCALLSLRALQKAFGREEHAKG